MSYDYDEHIKITRDGYINATVKQRYKVIEGKLNNPLLKSSELVSIVSGIEGLSRSMLLEKLTNESGKSRIAEYTKTVRNMGPAELIREYIMPDSCEDVFGEFEWKIFNSAISYRNLIVHEATTLRQSYSKQLLEISYHIYDKLIEYYNCRCEENFQLK